MKRPKVKLRKGEIGRVRIVEDFLPSRDKLVLTEVPRRRAGPKRKLASHSVGSKRTGPA
jgi:hypothetical protein